MIARSGCRRRPSWRFLVLLTILGAPGMHGAAAASPSEERSQPAPWYVYYQKGIQSMANDSWEDAVGLLEKALEERKPSQAGNRTYGMWQVEYTPYYNLAVCYFYLGRDQESLAALKRSEALEEIPLDSPIRRKSERIRRAIQGASGVRDADQDLMAQGLTLLLQRDGGERAVEVFQDLQRGREDDPLVHLFLGLAYARNAGSLRDEGSRFWHNLARIEFRRVHQLNPRLRLPEGFLAPEIEQLFAESAGR